MRLFEMRLCALLGVHSRRVLKHLLTHRDYQDWMALYHEDPWDQDRADLRAGIIASAAVAPYCKAGRQPRPADFMLYAKKAKRKPMSEESMKAVLHGASSRWGMMHKKSPEKKRA